MNVWIALLRGINVGGNHVVPMKDLRELLQGLGYRDIETYIQSGNCLFAADTADARGISRQISGTIEEGFGFRPLVMVYSPASFEAALAANPFPAGDSPKTVHFFFLAERPASPDLDGLAALAVNGERFHLDDDVFYLHAPQGIGRSKLVEKLGRFVPVQATARNLATVTRIAEMARARTARAS